MREIRTKFNQDKHVYVLKLPRSRLMGTRAVCSFSLETCPAEPPILHTNCAGRRKLMWMRIICHLYLRLQRKEHER
jgi:hypothetical protein